MLAWPPIGPTAISSLRSLPVQVKLACPCSGRVASGQAKRSELWDAQLLHPLLVLDQGQIVRSNVEREVRGERRQQPGALRLDHRPVLVLDDQVVVFVHLV